MSDWISVGDRLPEDGQTVIAFHVDWGVSECYFHYGAIEIGLNMDCATHWMPLPNPPE